MLKLKGNTIQSILLDKSNYFKVVDRENVEKTLQLIKNSKNLLQIVVFLFPYKNC